MEDQAFVVEPVLVKREQPCYWYGLRGIFFCHYFAGLSCICIDHYMCITHVCIALNVRSLVCRRWNRNTIRLSCNSIAHFHFEQTMLIRRIFLSSRTVSNGEVPRQDGAKKKKEKKRWQQGGKEGASWTEARKLEFLQKGTGQERYDWNPCHPPQSINSNTPTQMMHENPFMLQAGSEDNMGRERERKRYKKNRVKDKWIHAGRV